MNIGNGCFPCLAEGAVLVFKNHLNRLLKIKTFVSSLSTEWIFDDTKGLFLVMILWLYLKPYVSEICTKHFL